MGKVRFSLAVHGGKAHDRRVEAEVLARLLDGVARDVREVCQNIAQDDKGTAWEEKLESCRIYVRGELAAGSVVVSCETEESDIPWGERSLVAYADGLEKLRGTGPREATELPRGFSYPILNRIRQYYAAIERNYHDFSVTVGDRTIHFDPSLRLAVESMLTTLHRADRTLHGHSIRGVLYEVSDQHYDDPGADMTVEVDPDDGTHSRWVCHFPKGMLDRPMDEYFRKSVLIEGVAKFRPRKPEIHAQRIRVLCDLDFDDALRRFVAAGEAVWRDIDIDGYIDRVRERD